jgi:uncharacterized surface protein with fasciclin (FAS1) repeats/predicted small secreted protein
MTTAPARAAAASLVLLAALLAGCTTGDAAGEAVQEGRFDPGTLVGEEITVTGEVTRSPDGPVFRLSGDEFGGDGLAVVFPGVPALEEGALAEVTGVVTEADLEAINEHLDEGVSAEDVADLGDAVVLAAQDVRLLVPAAAGDAAPEAAEPVEDLAARLRAEGGFGTFLSGLSIAGLEELVRGDAPATVFVPGDAAFTDGSSAQVRDLLEDPERVDDILRHHAVEGAYTLDELRDVDELTTVGGETLAIATDGDQVLVGGVPVTGPSYRSGEVIAHVVGGILDPGAG